MIKRSQAMGYVVAALGTLLLVLLRQSLHGTLDANSPRLLMAVVIIAAACLGGWRAGLIGTLLLVAAELGLFYEWSGWQFRQPGDWIRLTLLLAVGGLLSWGCEVFLASQRRREADAERYLLEANERRATEQRLLESEGRLRVLTDNLPNGAFYQAAQDAAGVVRFTYVSAGMEALTGVAPAEVLADPAALYGLVHPEDSSRMLALENESLRTMRPFDCEFRMTVRSGELRWMHCRSAPRAADGNTVWEGLLLDITDRKRAEAVVRESELRYRMLATAANDVIWDWNLETGIILWSDALQKHFGHAPRSTATETLWWSGNIHPDDRERVLATLNRAIESGGATWECQYRWRRADRTYARVIDRGSIVHDEKGRATRMIGSIMDLSERLRIEEDLRLAGERSRLAVESADVGTWEYDRATGAWQWSARCQAMFGAGDAPITNYHAFVARVHPDDRARVREAFDAAFALGSTGRVAIEFRACVGEGVRWIVGRGKLLPPSVDDSDASSLRTIGTMIDITERKHSEQALREAHDRLEARVAERTLELIEANEFLQALLDNAHDGIVGCDAEGRLTLFNAAAQQFHGLTGEEVSVDGWARHYSLYDASGERLLRKEEVPLYQALSGAQVENVEIMIQPSDRPARTVLCSGQAFYGERGEKLGAVVTMHDITASKRTHEELKRAHEELEARVERRTSQLASTNEALQAEIAERSRVEVELQEANARKDELLRSLQESEETFRTLANSIPQLAWMARPDGEVFWYNRRWYEYTGMTPGAEAPDWRPAHDPDQVPRVAAKFFQAVASGEAWEDTFPLRRHDGAMRWHLSRAMPVRNERSETVCWFGTNTDITEQREMEEALREADRRKDQFLATLAHELRNPLAPISNALQLWAIVESDGAEMQRLRGMMERQVRQMIRLIDDLLDVSRITRGKVQLRTQRVDLRTAIEGAVEGVRPLLDSAGHRFTLMLPAEPLVIQGDVARLMQVFSNLLNNAAKYSGREGVIGLRCERAGHEAIVTVEDKGPGIPAHLLEEIFEMFSQADQTLSRAHGGLGIGLTLVKTLVTLHGGNVVACSDGLGHGSQFVVRLPLAVMGAEPLGEPTVDKPDRSPLPRHRVIVVDDVQASASTLAMMLSALGQEVSVCHDGPSAVAEALHVRPSVMFVDIAMPGMNGYEVAQRLRGELGQRSTTLVALTGYGQEEDRRAALSAGFDQHLVKPTSLDALQHVLLLAPPPEAKP